MDLNQNTITAALRAVSRIINTAAVLRGQVIDIVPVNPKAVRVSGDYPCPEERKIQSFKVILEKKDIQTVVRDRIFHIQKPDLPKLIVWNVEICDQLSKEIGLKVHAEDFNRVRINPSNPVLELTYKDEHPFYYGTITVRLSDVVPEQNATAVESIQEPTTELDEIHLEVYRPLFKTLQTGDRLSENHIEILKLATQLVWTDKMFKAVRNLREHHLLRSDENTLILTLHPDYQVRPYGRIKITL